jgi:hypothetical protein
MFFLHESGGAIFQAAPISTTPGLINVGMRNVYGFIKKYAETPLQTQAVGFAVFCL